MNETITTLSGLPEDERQFAYIIFEIIKDKYEKEYQTSKESKRVPWAGIKFQSQDFFDYTIMMTGLSIVQEYNSNQNWNQNWKAIAERMLDRLYKKCELEIYSECPKVYMLRKEGVLYNDLKEILGITQ